MRQVRNKKNRVRKSTMSNRFALVGITIVVASLAVTVNIKSTALKAQEKQLIEQETSLQKQLDDENARTSQLQQESVYVQTKEYIEKIAKEKLGLVNKDEVILKPSQNNN